MKQGKLQRFRMAAMLLIAGICLMIPVHVHADETFEYDILDDGTAKITAYRGEDSSEPITIPKELDGQYLVTQIGEDVFAGLSSLTTVSFHAESVVTSIGDRAFKDCSSLTSVTLPDSVTSIGESAFSGCVAFTTVTIPDNVEVIGAGAFQGCTAVNTVTIGESVREIGENAFAGDTTIATLNYALPESSWESVEIGGGNDKLGDEGTAKNFSQSYTSETFDNNGVTEVRITGYTGKAKRVVIPAKFGTYDVTRIADNAFNNNTTAEAIVLPERVTSIGNDAFKKCNSLLEMTIPGSVSEIGATAFYSCQKMRHLVIEGGETSLTIGAQAFKQCYALESVALPDRVTLASQGAFCYCTSLKAISFSGGQTGINMYTCQGCEALQSVTIPNKDITSINTQAFDGCTSLQVVFYGGTSEQWTGLNKTSGNDQLDSAHVYCGADSISDVFQYDIAEGTAEIRSYYAADEDCVIPAMIDGAPVTEIGNSAFHLIESSLKTVSIPEGVKRIGEGAFLNKTNLTTVTLPSTLEVIEKNAFYDCSKLAAITLPAGLETIGDYAFQKSGLTGITIPAGVTGIGKQAFDNCASLASVTVDGGNTVYQSQDGCLYSKDGKTLYLYPKGKTGAEYTVPAETTRIEDYAFYSNNKLTSVTIPGSVQAIGEYAFGSCRFLESVTLGEGLTQIGSRAFIGCSKLETITIPASVKEIGVNVFYNSGLTGIEVSGESTSFKAVDGVLYTASGSELVDYPSKKEGESFSVPAGVTKISADAFYGCKKLTEITLPAGLKEIGDEAFASCTGLTSLTIPDGVTTLESNAFNGCTSLTSVVLPASVTVIRENTFGGCTALANIYYKGSQQQWEQIVSQNQLNLGTVAMEYSYGHEHQFSCVASGATVTVSCTSEGCGYTTNKGYKVVIAAASKVYDGSAVTATVTKDTGFPSEVSVGSVTYAGREGTTYNSSTQAPVNAGKYTASVTVGDQTASVNFEITQSGGSNPGSQGGGSNPGSQGGGSNPGSQGGGSNPGSQGGGTDPGSQGGGTGSQDSSSGEKKNISQFTVNGIIDKTYTGKAITQDITVTSGTEKATVSVTYTNNIKVGTATVTIAGTGNYTGTIVKTFQITKAAQKMTVKAVSKSVKLSKVRKKKQTVTKALTVKDSIGKVTYAKVSKGSAKVLSIDKKSGKITVKKGTKKGTYKLKVKVTAAGNGNYKSASKTVTVKIKVK